MLVHSYFVTEHTRAVHNRPFSVDINVSQGLGDEIFDSTESELLLTVPSQEQT